MRVSNEVATGDCVLEQWDNMLPIQVSEGGENVRSK